ADILDFKFPLHDLNRESIENEEQIQIIDDVYRIRMITDEKSKEGNIIIDVYAESDFYNLAFITYNQSIEFNADTADVPMKYALEGTEWSVGNVNVTTKRTWESEDKNALSILREVQNIHGGDLIFDSANRLVHLLTFGGKDSGALFSYRKN